MRHDGYYDELIEEPRVRLRYLSVALALVALVGFVALAWYAYKAGTATTNPGEVPLVEAPDDPIRTKPDEPGGMAIPHRDKMVYEAIAVGDEAKADVIPQTMPQTEEPVAPVVPGSQGREDAEASLAEARSKILSAESQVDAKKTELLVGQAPVAVGVTADESSPVAAPLVPDPANIVPVPKIVVKTEPKPVESVVSDQKMEAATPRPVPESAGAKGYRLQLGAYKSEREAIDAWGAMQKKHSEVLSGASFVVEKADLKQKGIFYRLHVLAVSGESEARGQCKQLAARGQACFVVKR